MARRESYQSVIDRERDAQLPAAEPPRLSKRQSAARFDKLEKAGCHPKRVRLANGDEVVTRDKGCNVAERRGSGQPPHARKGTPGKRAIDRDLARYYEQCKSDTRGRFRTQRRQKNYCAAVAWKRAERNPDATRNDEEITAMPKRNPRTGRFQKKSGSPRRRRARAGETRRRSSAAMYEAPRPRRARRAPRRSREEARRSPRRRAARGRGKSQTNIAIVPVGVAGERRRRGRGRRRASSPRSYRAREPMMVGAGGVAMFTAGAAIGWLVADVIDRYFAGVDPAASPAPTLAAPYNVDNPIPKWNNDSAAMAPNFTRIGLQLLASVLFFGFGAMVTKSAAFKFFLYGIGGGALVHVSTQIITAYVIVPMVKTSTGTGARLYQHEINVYNGLANPSGGILGANPANRPGMRRGLLGAPPVSAAAPPPQLPANQPARMPVALASQATPQPVAVAPAQQQPPPQQQQRQEAPTMLGQPPAQQQPAAQPAAAAPANGAPAPHPLMAAWVRQAA